MLSKHAFIGLLSAGLLPHIAQGLSIQRLDECLGSLIHYTAEGQRMRDPVCLDDKGHVPNYKKGSAANEPCGLYYVDVNPDDKNIYIANLSMNVPENTYCGINAKGKFDCRLPNLVKFTPGQLSNGGIIEIHGVDSWARSPSGNYYEIELSSGGSFKLSCADRKLTPAEEEHFARFYANQEE